MSAGPVIFEKTSAPQLFRVGRTNTPLVVVDDIDPCVSDLIGVAAGLAPFPLVAKNSYPGVRRLIASEDLAAGAYVERTLQAVAPFIGGAFDADGFDLLEASFSIVTKRAEELEPQQRAPHFDHVDPRQLAILHYLSDMPNTGTAFYRQRATGIECVTNDTFSDYLAAAGPAALRATGYILDDDPDYERIGFVAGMMNRLVIYPSNLLHSGVIPPDANLSADPLVGRLTGTLFVRTR